MPLAPLDIDAATARRFQLASLGLASPHASVGAALAHHGYVQIDPLNVCGRMHDLILRNRVTGYAEGDLLRHTHGVDGDDDDRPRTLTAEARTAFEHHHPHTGILAVFGLEAWPHLQRSMRERRQRASAWSGRLTPKEKSLVPRLLDALGERGPLRSDDFAGTGRTHRGWGTASLAKSTLQKLFFHGRVLLARRDPAGRRCYDLPERILPAATRALPEPSATDTKRWTAHLKLRQRRLCVLTRDELSSVADLVQPLRATDAAGPTIYCLLDDVPLLETCARAATKSEAATNGSTDVRLVAPLDPLVYDRKLTRRLWGFDYTWEVYVPAAKRVRGYYALPVLAGDALVGHVEPKADRDARKLCVLSRSVPRTVRTQPAVRELARWLGLK